MDVHMERPRRSVPQFGGWDQKGGGGGGGGECTNYTVVFTQARADRKQHKTELPTPPYHPTPPPLHNTTNTAFTMPPPHHKHQQLHLHNHHHHHHHQNTNTTLAITDASIKRRKGVLSYFSCFNG